MGAKQRGAVNASVCLSVSYVSSYTANAVKSHTTHTQYPNIQLLRQQWQTPKRERHCLTHASTRRKCKQTFFYPDMWALASFGWDYFKHVGSEVHQKLHSSLDSANVVKQLFVSGCQAVPQPVFNLQNGRQVSELSVQQLRGELRDAFVVHSEVLRQPRQDTEFVLLVQTVVEVHKVQAVGLGRRGGFVSRLVCG